MPTSPHDAPVVPQQVVDAVILALAQILLVSFGQHSMFPVHGASGALGWHVGQLGFLGFGLLLPRLRPHLPSGLSFASASAPSEPAPSSARAEAAAPPS